MERSNSEYHVVSACQDPKMIGLRLDRQNDVIPLGPAKRSRASHQNMQNPCCQVEGCNLDLMLAKDYHRRHRICEGHSKSPKVIVAGMERRFCQQCSRFHDLSEFDDKKRSCRRRLSDHNARRRRVQPESVHLGRNRLPSTFYGLQIPITSSPMASDLLSAHSLLSSYSWSLNEDGNYNPRNSCYHGP